MFVRMSGRLWASFAVNRSADKTLLWIKLSERKKNPQMKSIIKVFSRELTMTLDLNVNL